jgi:hypothetical protein
MALGTMRTMRGLVAAGMAAGLIAGLAAVAGHAAEPPAAAADPHEAMAQHFAKHVQGHLDALAERLEIKASQQEPWQGFATAFRDVMTAHATDMGAPVAADSDAASMIRAHATRAAEHAQKLARLADATAKLQQALNPDQRQVFNEVARHFAQEHHGHGGMGGAGMMGHGVYFERHEDHCDGAREGSMHDGRDGDGHRHWEHGSGMHSEAASEGADVAAQ